MSQSLGKKSFFAVLILGWALLGTAQAQQCPGTCSNISSNPDMDLFCSNQTSERDCLHYSNVCDWAPGQRIRVPGRCEGEGSAGYACSLQLNERDCEHYANLCSWTPGLTRCRR